VVADRFGWIGPARREAVIRGLERELASWTRAWALGEPETTVGFVDAGTGGGWCAAGRCVATTGDLPALAAALVGATDEAPEGMAAHIASEALRDLTKRLARVDGSTAWPADGVVPSALRDERLGALAACFEVRGVAVCLRMGRLVVDRLAPPRAADVRHLSARKDACLVAPVRLQATLDLGDMPLAELRGLRPGDVLLTRSALDTAVRLCTDGADTPGVASAHLGARDGRRALRILSS
jgi:hypothetical protein